MSRYASARPGSSRAQDNLHSLKGFTTIRELLSGNVARGRAVRIVGIVKDCRLPVPTAGTDYKCTITLYDTSTGEDNEDIDINVFRKEAEMPDVGAGDVVVVLAAKVQMRSGTYSLLTSYQTDIHVYDVRQLASCKRSGTARSALKEPTKKVSREPDTIENEYVLSMFERIDKTLLPDQEQFLERKRQSLNVREKFSLLQDIRDAKFVNLAVQVVREPYDLGDKMTLWVSDYTENSSFFHKTRDSADWDHGEPVRDGDPYGYTNGRKKQVAPLGDGDWDGPVGKKSLQLTCWEPHASFIRDNVHSGDWVRLRNVQIGFGHSSMNLEGFMRGDRQYPDRVYVEILDLKGGRETLDLHLIEALRRKRDYEKEHKQVLRTGEKRKAEEPAKKGKSKTNRLKKRANQRKAMEEEQANQKAALGLNELVISEYDNSAIVPLSVVVKPVHYSATIDGQEVDLELPFTCATYRSNVRVVDFCPDSLKNFAVGRAVTEYDVLSDNEDSDSSSTSSRSSIYNAAARRCTWEWRFALKLEEASTSVKTKTPVQIWAIVDNLDAQLLLNLDAKDLHNPQNAADVDTLRERLFKLWGNLEERKTRLETKRQHHVKNPLNAPPPDSSDVEDSGAPAIVNESADNVPGSQLSNRPFTCCIRQYGVKVRTEKGEVATAGEGKKWQRVFGLFGTKISDE